jgi:nucleoid-associated protein YgaU
MMMDLLDILRGMNHDDDDLWTVDNQPRLEYINAMAGEGEEIRRKDVVEAAPNFQRYSPILPDEEEEIVPDDEEEDVEVVAARNALAVAEAEERRTAANLENAKAEHDAAVKAMDTARDAVTKLDPPMSNAQRLRNFIESSNKERMKRYQRQQTVMANLPAGSIDPRMPIDKVFERKNKRGDQRPTR